MHNCTEIICKFLNLLLKIERSPTILDISSTLSDFFKTHLIVETLNGMVFNLQTYYR